MVLRFLQVQVAERSASENDISQIKVWEDLQVVSLKSVGMNSGSGGSSERGLTLYCFPVGWLHSQAGDQLVGDDHP